MTPENLILERIEPGIQLIKISRPKALNALNTATLKELDEVLRDVAADASVRVVVITGDGEKSFIAGADITEMQHKTPQQAAEFAGLGHEVTKHLELMPKPTIAAVNGFAFGGGTEMAIACDFILASANAVFAQPEVGLGIIPGFGANVRLAKFVGLARAKEMIFSGRRVKADEAAAIGLVNRVFPAEEFMARVIEVAQQISRNSRTAVACAKRLINETSESVGLNAKLDAEAQAFGGLFGGGDQLEGMTAFVEKRKPGFEGL